MSHDDRPHPEDAAGNDPALVEALHRALERAERGGPAGLEGLLPEGAEGRQQLAEALRAARVLDQFVRHVEGESGISIISALSAPTEAFEPWAGPLPQPFPGEYVIQGLLGKGAFAQVWLAYDLKLRTQVALKTIRLHGGQERRSQALAMLENDARILAELRHPNILQVHAWRQSGEEHYLVMQYVPGRSLQARLENDGPLSWQLAARYIADVGEALLHVHAHGIVHRDVKLANILWDRQRDEALLTDFGLAARLADGGQVAGTPQYMAPEAFAGWSSPAVDVYGLAASLFALVTGRVPFPAGTREDLLELINRGLPEPEPLFAGVPERLERVIRSGLAAAPARRPELAAFVADLRGSLNRLLADSLVLPATPAGWTHPPDLRLAVARWEGGDVYVPVATTHPMPSGMTRNLTKVPPLPARAGLRTGDRVRIEVVADRDGFLTVFNVGPTGHLSLLYPDPGAAPAAPPPLAANRPLYVSDVALTPPAGGERLVAVWSRAPLSLPLEELARMTRGGGDPVSRPYRATRDMERVQASVQQLRPEDWRAAVLELDHTDS